MNFVARYSLVIGFVTTCLVLFLSVEGSWDTYLQMHSIIIVMGGTTTILFFSTPGNVLSNLARELMGLFHTDDRFADYKDELLQLARNRHIDAPSNNELINYAAELWEQGVNPDLFIALISQKRSELVNQQVDTVQTMKNLAKYPPALGMTGTVMGMVALFASLDSNKGNVGSSLAIAMTATFFGLILTNAVISPVADRLQIRNVHFKRMMTSVYEVLLLINQGEPTTLINDEVESRAA